MHPIASRWQEEVRRHGKEQRTSSSAPTVRLTGSYGLGLGLLGESDLEPCMAPSMEPNVPLVNRPSARFCCLRATTVVQGEFWDAPVEGGGHGWVAGPVKIG
jgi:hypothetical protein